MKREQRDLALPCRQTTRVAFELRNATTAGDGLVVEGHASVFDVEYEVYGGPARYGWIERIAEAAFDETLAEDPDVVFLFNHEGMPLARTKSGTLELSTDTTGLLVRTTLDPVNPHVVALGSALERGDVDEMSIGFRAERQTWEAHDDWPEDEMSLRTIEVINLNRGDVSAVTHGASPTTDIGIVRSLDDYSVAELRKMSADIEQRLSEKPSGGTPEGADDGMSGATLRLLIPPPNPTLEGFPPHVHH